VSTVEGTVGGVPLCGKISALLHSKFVKEEPENFSEADLLQYKRKTFLMKSPNSP